MALCNFKAKKASMADIYESFMLLKFANNTFQYVFSLLLEINSNSAQI